MGDSCALIYTRICQLSTKCVFILIVSRNCLEEGRAQRVGVGIGCGLEWEPWVPWDHLTNKVRGTYWQCLCFAHECDKIFILAFYFYLLCIQHSCTPPWWEPAGGLKIHLMLCWRRNAWIFSCFHCQITSRRSFSPAIKFPLLSVLTCFGMPLAVNHLNAFIKKLDTYAENRQFSCVLLALSYRWRAHHTSSKYFFLVSLPMDQNSVHWHSWREAQAGLLYWPASWPFSVQLLLLFFKQLLAFSCNQHKRWRYIEAKLLPLRFNILL